MSVSIASQIYLDHNATTPVCPETVQAMMPYLEAEFGNPSSGYALGSRAKKGVAFARDQVSSLLKCSSDEIVFTSGGSESNNMVLKGVLDFNTLHRHHIITSAVEHPAILNPAIFLMELGVDISFVTVDGLGRVNPDEIKKAILPHTSLISVMLANNETGTLQPLKEISRIAKAHGIPVHTDAAQAVGKMDVDVDDLGVDFLTVAGHKLYGPKGVGVMYIRNGRDLTPLIHGAGQESGRRAGTENVILAAGLGAACAVAEQRREKDAQHSEGLRNRLQVLLFEGIDGLVLNGHPEDRLPNTLNISVPGLEGTKILEAIPAVMASTGAACHDQTVKLSHVLSAMGVLPEIGMGALRFSVGRGNTLEMIETAAGLIIEQVRKMRK